MSVLTIRPLSHGKRGSSFQSDNELILYNKNNTKAVIFPKPVGAMIRTGNYRFVQYQRNDVAPEVWIIFSKNNLKGSMEIDTDNKREDKNRKFKLRSKYMVEFIMEDLNLHGEKTTLKLSPNQSNKEDMLSFRITRLSSEE